MIDAQAGGVQGRSVQQGAFFFAEFAGFIGFTFYFRQIQSATAAVQRIDGQRVTDALEVDANLVGPTGFQLDFCQGILPETLQYPVKSQRGFAGRTHHHFTGNSLVLADRFVDFTLVVVYHAFQNDMVKFIDRMVFKLQRQMPVRLLRAGENQNTAGIAVEPVYRHDLFITALQKAEQMLTFPAEAVGNRKRTGRFFHDQDMIVFI